MNPNYRVVVRLVTVLKDKQLHVGEILDEYSNVLPDSQGGVPYRFPKRLVPGTYLVQVKEGL